MADKETRIMINPSYEIGFDNYNHTLYKAVKSKKGKDYMKAVGYYPSMEKAMVACRNDMAKDSLYKADVWTLDDALAVFVRTTNHLEAIVKHNFEGVTV